MIKRPCLRLSVICSSVLVGALLTATSAQAALNQLDDQSLSTVTGQANTGVNVALTLGINQLAATPGTSNCGAGATQTPAINCRIAFQINNVANWFVLKGFNGTINIPQLTLFGADLSDPAVNAGTAIKQSAIGINVAFPAAGNPATTTAIQFKNLNYIFAISVNSLQFTAAGGKPTPTTDQNAYYAGGTYGTAADNLNFGRETGIFSVAMNGNLNVGGQVYVFSK